MCGAQQHLQNMWATVKEYKGLYTIWQHSHVINDEYLKSFNSQVTILEIFDGELPNNPLLFKQKLIEAGVSNPNNASDLDQDISEKAVVY